MRALPHRYVTVSANGTVGRVYHTQLLCRVLADAFDFIEFDESENKPMYPQRQCVHCRRIEKPNS